MTESELKQIYKDLKREAMTLFDKTAVGDVKEQFYAQLKNQMSSKYEIFSLENEKTSD